MAELSPQLHRDVHTSLEIEGRNPQFTLTIKARAEYNGTTVQCLINGGFSDQSDNVSLIIQGTYYPKKCFHVLNFWGKLQKEKSNKYFYLDISYFHTYYTYAE